MDKVFEHSDYSVKDEVISEVSGGKVTADSGLITCASCGARLAAVPANFLCPKCGNCYRARKKPAAKEAIATSK